jgi:hypothetical protein
MSVSEWIDKKLGHYQFTSHLRDRLLTARQSAVHEILSRKPFRAVMTTNYDQLIDIHWHQAGKNPFVVVPNNTGSIAAAQQALNAPRTETIPIIRIHGALNDPDTVIFFPRDYREIMFRNEAFRQFIAHTFRNFTILFIGTSFRDPNTQSLLQWIRTITDGKEAPLYAILDSRGTVFKNYVRQNFNVQFMTYPAPNNDHSALRPLLESLWDPDAPSL